ncbi:MAG: hypothetical protein IKN73_01050 [Alphaproteobacteria bacterium]|nr:hypothetical protein [Alphaproteobacteria bacterium]
MKKFLLLAVLFIPFAVSAAPSVRVLGNKNAGTVQMAPAKASNIKQANTARIGTLRTKTSGLSGVLTSSGSRFPVISSTKPYSTVQPSGGNTGSNIGGNTGTNTGSNTGGTPSSTGSCNVCTDTINEIVDTVTDRVEGDVLNNYYDKTETYNKEDVYNNNEFTQAVSDIIEDDPRIDAIRTRNPANLHPGAELPSDYIYVWIEQ